MTERFVVEGEITRQYRRFNAERTQLTVRVLPPPNDNSSPVSYFLDSMTEMFQYALRNANGSDMVGITIHNEVNEKDKPIGISFRQKEQLSRDVIWGVFEKVANLMHALTLLINSL